MAIRKNRKGLYDIVCDNCKKTQKDLEGEEGYESQSEAREYMDANIKVWYAQGSKTVCFNCHKAGKHKGGGK